jgi:hypothetical protein
MIHTEELTGTTEYLTLQRRLHIKCCRYNRVRLHFKKLGTVLFIYILIYLRFI